MTNTLVDNLFFSSLSLCFSIFSANMSSSALPILVKWLSSPGDKLRALAYAFAVARPALLSSSRNSSVITIPLDFAKRLFEIFFR